jgi:hypothetical protein
MFASIATYPHEVVRTQLQIQKRARAAAAPGAAATVHQGLVGTVRELLHAEGWRGLYKGLSINLIRTVPNSAVTMLRFVTSSAPGRPYLTAAQLRAPHAHAARRPARARPLTAVFASASASAPHRTPCT